MEIQLKQTQRQPAVSNGILGMIFVLATEAMFFSGLISAYIVNRSGAMMWPPYGQPRLPVEVTAVNTLVLLASGICLFAAAKQYRAGMVLQPRIKQLIMLASALGGVFLLVQGFEWAQLLVYGLSTRTSLYGAFFYLIVGMHAAHVVAGICVLIYLYRSLAKLSGAQLADRIQVCSLYWYFVVGVWPVLYILVYLI